MKLTSLIDEKFGLPGNVGRDFGEMYVKEFINNFNELFDQNIIFFLLLSLTIIFFLLSIQFSIKASNKFIKSVLFFEMKFFSLKKKQ